MDFLNWNGVVLHEEDLFERIDLLTEQQLVNFVDLVLIDHFLAFDQELGHLALIFNISVKDIVRHLFLL